MNLPNILTLLRIVLSGVFLYTIFIENFTFRVVSLVIFLIASVTDYLDGFLARKLGQMSEFGQLMDPIADKFLTLSAFLAFVQMGMVPAWMVAIILTRDIVITLMRFSMPPSSNQGARKSGKQKTVLQFACIVGILIYLTLKETAFWKPEWNSVWGHWIYYSMLLIVVMTVWSGARYLFKNAKTN